MCSTLFHIPLTVWGLPVFGFGLLLAAWAVFSAVLLGYQVWRQGFSADTQGYVWLLAVLGAAIVWVLPRVCDEHGLPLRGYGLMLLLAVVSGTALATWRAKRLGLHPDLMVSVVMWMFVPGIVGARMFYVIEYWTTQFARPTWQETLLRVVNVAEGGLVVYGSLIGGLLGLLAFCRVYRVPLLALADLIAPSLLLGLALGRVGCLLNGCCYGGPCDQPWAVTFPWNSPPHRHQVEAGQLYVHGLKLEAGPGGTPRIAFVEPGSHAEQAGLRAGQEIAAINKLRTETLENARDSLLSIHRPGEQLVIHTRPDDEVHAWTPGQPSPRSLPVHPTQVYSTIDALVLMLLLLAYDPFHRRDGQVLALMLTVYPVTRFLVERIRTDEAAIFNTGMTISQNVSLLTLAAAAGLWIYILSRPAGLAFRSGEHRAAL